ncbi:MAG: hypothetical protein Ct9H300mP12_07880 [Acidimicrobiales bacterium]|nr:MAG: hypothetical protein Ct9H300mP12_07880 [Acidimicrobiales bacterium]
MDPSETKAQWDEVIREIPACGSRRTMTSTASSSPPPPPTTSFPSLRPGTPPDLGGMWQPAYLRQGGSLGIGAIAFNFEPIHNLKGSGRRLKEASRPQIEQIGQYKNDNVMMTNACICREDRDGAPGGGHGQGPGYLVTMVNMYHDTMPKSPDAMCGRTPPSIRAGPMSFGHGHRGWLHAVRQPRGGLRAGRALPGGGLRPGCLRPPHRGLTHDQTLEMIELFGDQVIPEYDRDRTHSTAVPGYSPAPLPGLPAPGPEGIDVSVSRPPPAPPGLNPGLSPGPHQNPTGHGPRRLGNPGAAPRRG